MSLKQKLLDIMEGHPKLVVFITGLGLTIAIGTAVGMFDHSHSVQAIFYPEWGVTVAIFLSILTFDSKDFKKIKLHINANFGSFNWKHKRYLLTTVIDGNFPQEEVWQHYLSNNNDNPDLVGLKQILSKEIKQRKIRYIA